MNYGAKSAFSNECEGERENGGERERGGGGGRESVREMVICLYIFLSFIELQLKYEKGLEW
jgi:hypothetical protein